LLLTLAAKPLPEEPELEEEEEIEGEPLKPLFGIVWLGNVRGI
jgi:hypothetical protein